MHMQAYVNFQNRLFQNYHHILNDETNQVLDQLQKRTLTVITAQALYVEQRCEKTKSQNIQNDTHLIPKDKWGHSLQASVEVNYWPELIKSVLRKTKNNTKTPPNNNKVNFYIKCTKY